MSTETFGRDFWERRWGQALREHPDKVASRPPNAHLLAGTAGLHRGLALDAGCGHGSEALWLAGSGWRVSAVDFSSTALEHARSTAQTLGADIAERIEWIEADLATWRPPSRRYDLVTSLYVHVAGPVGEMVRRLGAGVAPGGTLLLVGHRPIDPATGAPTPAAGQVQVSVDEAVEALDPREWQIAVAEERPRAAAGSGVDAVVRAIARTQCAEPEIERQLRPRQRAGRAHPGRLSQLLRGGHRLGRDHLPGPALRRRGARHHRLVVDHPGGQAGKLWARAAATTMFVLGTGTGTALLGLLVKDASGETGLPPLLGWVGMLPCLAGLFAVTLLWRNTRNRQPV